MAPDMEFEEEEEFFEDPSIFAEKERKLEEEIQLGEEGEENSGKIPGFGEESQSVSQNKNKNKEEPFLFGFLVNAADDDEENNGKIPGKFDENSAVSKTTAAALKQERNIEDDLEALELKNIAKNWAGPEHWKLAKAKNSSSGNKRNLGENENEENNENENSKKTTSKRRKKEALFIDFFAAPTEDLEKAFSAGKGATTISISSHSNTNLLTGTNVSTHSGASLLPEDVHYDLKMLTTLFNKPYRISHQRLLYGKNSTHTEGFQYEKKNEEEDEDHIEPAFMGFHGDQNNNENNLQESVAFFEEISKNNQHKKIEEELDLFQDPKNEISGPEISSEFRLVEQPKKVEQIKINFATSAKFVDVKLLKEKVWKILDSHLVSETNEEDMEKKKKSKNSKIVPSTILPFQSALEKIPNEIPNEMKNNISVPFAFICLLHLCNEHNLILKQTPKKLDNLTLCKE
jgi:condensin complex subunit 2